MQAVGQNLNLYSRNVKLTDVVICNTTIEVKGGGRQCIRANVGDPDGPKWSARAVKR
jgi:hypothetical protein